MLISEYIQKLEEVKAQHGDLMVVERKRNSHMFRWVSMDGWWPQLVTVAPVDNPLSAGEYRESTDGIDALEI